MANDAKEIQSFLSRQTQQVQKNSVIVSSVDFYPPYLLHISEEKNPKYVPRVGWKQADSEDRTVPRVTAAKTLLGCIIGYSVFGSNYFEVDKEEFKEGLYIQRIPFVCALKPNKKLVYDQPATDEHWLVNYGENTAVYPSEHIGKIFINRITFSMKTGCYPEAVYEAYVFVSSEALWSEKVILTPGYYRITFPFNVNTTWKQTANTEIVKVTKSEFDERKKIVADMLSADNGSKKPVYTKW